MYIYVQIDTDRERGREIDETEGEGAKVVGICKQVMMLQQHFSDPVKLKTKKVLTNLYFLLPSF